MSPRHTILIVDDEAYVRDSLAEILAGDGFQTVLASSIAEAIEQAQRGELHAIVTDLKMPSGDALALLAGLKRLGITLPTIVITGVGSITDAVAAMKAGAYDFLQKPVEPDQLVLQIERAVEHHRLVSEVRLLRAAATESSEGRALVGSSPALERVRAAITQVASTSSPVLVTGESGTGKELVAEMIHRQSTRVRQNLVRVNCAAIPEPLFESEFFGHRRGSFSGAISDRVGRFAEAEQGTLVLDEIGTLAGDLQAKLLRVLDSGEYQVIGESRTRVADVRIIAATNDALAQRVQAGAFRADLYYRLNVFPIEVPPLRQHKEDIAEIARHLIERSVRTRTAMGRTALTLSDEAIGVLASYDWPGNVRELRNVLERAFIIAGTGAPDARLLRGMIESSVAAPGPGGVSPGDLTLRDNVDALERKLILQALERSGGKKRDAAQLLGIDPKNLGYYFRKHALGEGVTPSAGAGAHDA